MRWQPLSIVGGSYADDALPWSHQDTVNYLPVPAEKSGTRSSAILRCLPGFSTFCDLGTGAPIRGARNVEGLLVVVSGKTLFKVSPDGTSTVIGMIPGVQRCSLSHNQIAGGNQVAISNGQSGYVYNTVTGTLAQITDEGFPGSICFDFVDGYMLGIDPSRRRAFTSDLADATSYNTLDQYEAEGSPDLLRGQAVTHREWWLMGERTIEPFTNTGAGTGTFQRSQGTVIEVGLAATHAVAVMDNSVFWLGNDGIVYRANGYTPQRISTHAIEQAIARCNITQAFAFTFEDRGHKVFYLTFPDGHTWGYDAATGEWHRRKSYGIDRWRINTLTKWNGMWMAGDYSNGKLYALNWDVQHEDGAVLERRRITGVTSDSQNAMIINGVELVFDTGIVEAAPSLGGSFSHDYVLSASGNLADGDNLSSVTFLYSTVSNRRPVTAAITSGGLPTGLSLSSDGSVSGTRSAVGDFSWEVTFTDADGNTTVINDSSKTLGATTLDPSTLSQLGTGGTIAADNLTVTKINDSNGFSAGARVYAADVKTSGKYYFEATVLVPATRAENRGMDVGLERADRFAMTQQIGIGDDTVDLSSEGTYHANGTYYSSGGPFYNTAGATVGIAVDLDTGKWWWRNASGWNPSGDPATGTSPMGTLTSSAMTGGVVPFVTAYSAVGSIRANFGNAPFVLGDVPTGFNPGWGLFA